MPQRRVTFTTDAKPADIRKALLAIPGHTYFEIDEPTPKQKWSDRRQIAVIWLLAIIVILGVFLYIEVSTRP